MSEGWTFLTNHARVLLCLARDPHARMVDVAEQIGIRERSVQQIVSDLERDGYLRRQRVGRRNVYSIKRSARFRHAVEAHHDVGELLDIFVDEPPRPTRT